MRHLWLWPLALNFKDPASVYAYSLMHVHHQVMWYMVLILAVVYWSFYRIVREYNWHTMGRRQGVLFVWIHQEHRLDSVNNILDPLWVATTVFLARFYWTYNSWFFEAGLLQESDFAGYQGWGRMFITLLNLQHGHRGGILGDHFDLGHLRLSPTVAEELHVERHLSLTCRARRRWNLAYFYSTTTTSANEALLSQRFRENLMLEYLWALVPSLIIFLILIPSLYLLYSLEERVDPKLNVKVIGHQWFWTYECYSASLDLSFQYDSTLVPESDLTAGAKRLLEVDRRLFLPLNLPLRILVTSSDVLHAWAVPELGIKVDAVPGRLNDALCLIRRPGTFYGQCSELCGVGHGFMPIAVESIGFHRWVETVKTLDA